jgi:hypothetical protein
MRLAIKNILTRKSINLKRLIQKKSISMSTIILKKKISTNISTTTTLINMKTIKTMMDTDIHINIKKIILTIILIRKRKRDIHTILTIMTILIKKKMERRKNTIIITD